MGDFNIPANDLDLSGFPQLARGRVCTPSDVEVTCAQGRGSMIDYVVASKDLAYLLDVKSFDPSPFKTHC
eukprot:376442-Pyramimonas_sp.AAC.1